MNLFVYYSRHGTVIEPRTLQQDVASKAERSRDAVGMRQNERPVVCRLVSNKHLVEHHKW